jgi:hypothetical protein
VRPAPARGLIMFVPAMHLPNPHDPCKEPSRRWHRSGYLLDHGRQPLQDLDDALTREAWHFRRALTQCCTEADREQLAQDYPGLAEAYGVYTGEPPKRWELEARLLGGDADVTVAARCGLSAAAVAAYHATFYEVRPHLLADTYVTTVLIGLKAYGGLTLADHEQLLKLFGYGLGGSGVDAVLDFFADPPTLPASLNSLDLPELKQLRDRLRIKIAVLLLTTPATAARPETWEQIWRQYTAARRASQGSGEGAVLASTHGLLDVVNGLSNGVQAKADEAAA